MKRFLALVLCLMLLVPTAFADTAELLPGYWKPPAVNEGQYPVKGAEGITLTYWNPIFAGAAAFISSQAENDSYIAMQENTGVKLEFIHPAAGTERESFQLLMGGELPDIILMQNGSYYTGDLQAMYDDGIIIDLAPYLDEYAPQYKACATATELAEAQCFADGKALGMYKMTHADKMPYTRVNINKDWMREAGIENEPKTIAEYEAYFDWILANKPGVTPLYIGNLATTDTQTMNLFTGAFNFLYDWFLVEGDATQVGYWANAPEYKDFLTLMKNWYDKGYLGKDFMGIALNEAQAMFDSGNLGALCASVDATYTRVNALENGFEVTNLPYMRKEADSVLGSGLANTPVGDGGEWVSVVTTACKHPEIAVQFLNYGWTLEGALIANFGIEGKSWDYDENMIPRYYKEVMINNPNGMTFSNAGNIYRIHFGPKYCFPDDIAHATVASNPEALRIRTMWKGDENEQNYLQLPPVKFTAEEQTERADLIAQVDTYAKEMMIKFITGAEPLDNYDAYVKAVEEYGLLDAIAITQTAVDRFHGAE